MEEGDKESRDDEGVKWWRKMSTQYRAKGGCWKEVSCGFWSISSQLVWNKHLKIFVLKGLENIFPQSACYDKRWALFFVVVFLWLFSLVWSGWDAYFHAPIEIEQHLNENRMSAEGFFGYVSSTVNQTWSNHTHTVTTKQISWVFDCWSIDPTLMSAR